MRGGKCTQKPFYSDHILFHIHICSTHKTQNEQISLKETFVTCQIMTKNRKKKEKKSKCRDRDYETK